MRCAYHSTTCPLIDCPANKVVTLENQCCPVCIGDDFCSLRPCHPNATCVNRKHDRECRCKAGFFGDGEECFDVDECKVTTEQGADQRPACSVGSRCINTVGSFYCECLPGYVEVNDHQCLDVIY
ncbi:unnamed protein product [Soboliphyme baturini]|uniref:EGF-like domain-containing protein n=1 Tax=Soboliphyme baturini TaxID=241478 RepID=A0A183J9S3_9BILA|nr:unnamed protein product [Soboliphyme baturini]